MKLCVTCARATHAVDFRQDLVDQVVAILAAARGPYIDRTYMKVQVERTSSSVYGSTFRDEIIFQNISMHGRGIREFDVFLGAFDLCIVTLSLCSDAAVGGIQPITFT